MIGFDAVANTLRKPALALLAAAGLVVGGIGGGVATGHEPALLAGSAMLVRPDQAAAPALAQAGGATLLLADAGERPQSRGPGGDRGLSGVMAAAGFAARVPRSTPPRSVSTGPTIRAGRDNAPSTGPPSFPS